MLAFFPTLYEYERSKQGLGAEDRQRLRVLKAIPVLDAFHHWLLLKCQQATDGSAAAIAIGCSLKRWGASPASSTTCPSTRTTLRTESGRLRWDEQAGCWPARSRRAARCSGSEPASIS